MSISTLLMLFWLCGGIWSCSVYVAYLTVPHAPSPDPHHPPSVHMHTRTPPVPHVHGAACDSSQKPTVWDAA